MGNLFSTVDDKNTAKNDVDDTTAIVQQEGDKRILNRWKAVEILTLKVLNVS